MAPPRRGALVDLLRRRGSPRHSRGFNSFMVTQAERPGKGGTPVPRSAPPQAWEHPAQPQDAMRGSHRGSGTPAAERIFMLSPGIDISVDQSNISQVFFLLATGMRSFGLGVLDVEKLLLGGGHAAVPGARAVAPLDASIMLCLPPIHVVLLHRPVCPETLVRGGDEAGDGEAARDLRTTETVTDQSRGERGVGGTSTGQWGWGWCSASPTPPSSAPGVPGCPFPSGHSRDVTPMRGD